MKGRVLMEFAIRSGYVENPGTMRDYYNDNQSAIEGWLEQMDVKEMIDDAQ